MAAEAVHSSGSLGISSISLHERSSRTYPFGLGIISSRCIISYLFVLLLSFALLISSSTFLMHTSRCDFFFYSRLVSYVRFYTVPNGILANQSLTAKIIVCS